jgi:hypothetical protein
MADATTLWSDDASQKVVKLAREPSPQVIRLLERTVWGGRGLLYEIRGIDAKLRRLSDPHVFSVEAEGRLAAVCILNRKTALVLGAEYDAFHFVMVATDEAERSKGLANLLGTHIRRFCEDAFRGPGVGYGYIEASTEYSLRLSDRIGHTVGRFVPLTVFSRFFPRDDPGVRPVSESEADGVRERLYALYEGHSLLDFDTSLRPEEYFVLSREGRIVAGAQAEVLHWSVVRMPGLMGRFIVGGLPHIPGLRSLLNVKDFYFLRFGNLLVRPGDEAQLVTLLEALLARNGLRIGLILMDQQSPVFEGIRAFGKFGVMNAALRGTTKVVADFRGVTEDEIAAIRSRPVLVSAGDVI